jgi:hypothetical protein
MSNVEQAAHPLVILNDANSRIKTPMSNVGLLSWESRHVVVFTKQNLIRHPVYNKDGVVKAKKSACVSGFSEAPFCSF